jgi:hypothetical protein
VAERPELGAVLVSVGALELVTLILAGAVIIGVIIEEFRKR